MSGHDVQTDVLICGAGAAGLTLAIDLARRGIAFRLIEQRLAPFHGSRGKGLQPRTLEVFENLGIAERVFAAGGDYPPQREYQEDGQHVDSAFIIGTGESPGEPFPRPRMVPQFATEAVLRERLRELGARVEFGVTLVALEQDADGVSARLAQAGHEEALRVRYLVGTDGGGSFVRKALGIDFPGKTLGVRALVADVELTGLDRGAWHRFNSGTPAAQLAICPLAGTALFQIQAPVALEGEVDLSAAGLQALVRERSGRADIAIHAVHWASAYSMNARLAARYRFGRVLLAGDAAHTHPPTGGQGLNTSVQDAHNLGWKLAAMLDGAPEAVLDSYEQERRPIAAGMLGLATRLLDAARQGEMQRGREVRQLDLAYPDSPFNLEHPPCSSGLRAGTRAPDAPVRGASGVPVRLFQLFAGGHWTLLGQDTARTDIAARPGLRIHTFGLHGDLQDSDGHFHAAYGLRPGQWLLVRPDGYVAAVVDADARQALEQLLQQVGLATATTA